MQTNYPSLQNASNIGNAHSISHYYSLGLQSFLTSNCVLTSPRKTLKSAQQVPSLTDFSHSVAHRKLDHFRETICSFVLLFNC
jgi:hypothetical protein